MEISSSGGSIGLQAFQNAQQRVDKASNDIAQSQTNQQTQTGSEVETQALQTPPVTESQNSSSVQNEALLELQQGEQQAQAAARVVDVEDQVLGSLLDVHA